MEGQNIKEVERCLTFLKQHNVPVEGKTLLAEEDSPERSPLCKRLSLRGILAQTHTHPHHNPHKRDLDRGILPGKFHGIYRSAGKAD